MQSSQRLSHCLVVQESDIAVYQVAEIASDARWRLLATPPPPPPPGEDSETRWTRGGSPGCLASIMDWKMEHYPPSLIINSRLEGPVDASRGSWRGRLYEGGAGAGVLLLLSSAYSSYYSSSNIFFFLLLISSSCSIFFLFLLILTSSSLIKIVIIMS